MAGLPYRGSSRPVDGDEESLGDRLMEAGFDPVCGCGEEDCPVCRPWTKQSKSDCEEDIDSDEYKNEE
jgi:hypothetical protein